MRISDWSSDVCSSDLLSSSKDFTWDSIEATVLEGLSKRVGLEKDTDTLLRIAAVANKAQRRMTQKEEHVLDPASAVARVPLKLTKRFTEKLNHDGSVEDRTSGVSGKRWS